MKRLTWLRLGFALTALSVFVGLAGAQDNTNPYAPYAGTTIVVSWPNQFHFQQAATLIPQFTEETGINVEVDFVQYENLVTAQEAEFQKPRGGEYDVVSWVVFSKTEYVANGYLTPLAQFFANPALADPTYNPDDLVQAWVETGGVVGGRKGYLPGPLDATFGVPFGAETSILMYRKDIFDEYNLKVPETYDELLETAAFITENVPDVYGMTTRGSAGPQIVHAFLLHLSPYGGEVFDDNWNVMLDQPEARQAAEALKTIIENAPPGVLSYGFGEQVDAFLQGDAAMYLDSHRTAPSTRNPDVSRIVGEVGFALHPRVEGMNCGLAETGGFMMGIPSNSQNKEAAFLFTQWMTSPRIDRQIALLGGDPSRMSTFSDPELQAQFPEYEVILKQLECANPDWRPLIAQWGAISGPILGVYLHEYVSGERSLDDAMAVASEEIRAAMERAGYYSWQTAEPAN